MTDNDVCLFGGLVLAHTPAIYDNACRTPEGDWLPENTIYFIKDESGNCLPL